MLDIDKALIECTTLSEREVRRLEEEDKTKIADKAVTKLYKAVQKQANDVRIPEVENSRGDITKVPNYKEVIEAQKFLKAIANKGDGKGNEELKELVDDLQYGMQFLNGHKKFFIDGYKKNTAIVKNCYVAIAGMEIQLTAYAISKCVGYKNNGVSYECEARKVVGLKANKGYRHLKEILNLAKKNKLDKNLKQCLNLQEADLNLAWIGVAMLLLTNIRGICHMFLSSRVKMAEYLDTVKGFVELNKANVRDPKIKQKQQKWVDRLEKLRDKIAIDQQVASSRADEMPNDDATLDPRGSDELGNLDNELGIF